MTPAAPAAAPSAPAAEPAPAAPAASAPEGNGVYHIRVFFDEGCELENVRAFVLTVSITALSPAEKRAVIGFCTFSTEFSTPLCQPCNL